jgi:hypothetical protein
MTLEDRFSSKYRGTHKMLEAFLASKGFTPVVPLARKKLFPGSDLAKSKSYAPKAKYFITTVPSPVDTAPRNVYHFNNAAMHRPMAGLTHFYDEKKNSRHSINERSSKTTSVFVLNHSTTYAGRKQ